MKTQFVLLLLAVSILGTITGTAYSATLPGTSPLIYLVPEATSSTTTTLAIVITENTEALNVLELELFIDPAIFSLEATNVHSDLCLPEFTIENSYDAESGVWYLACGTYIPFTSETAILGTIEITHAVAAVGIVSFGERTHVYQHDGYGTQIIPTTVAVVVAPEPTAAL